MSALRPVGYSGPSYPVACAARSSVERVEYRPGEMVLRITLRAYSQPLTGTPPVLVIEHGEVELVYTPIVVSVGRSSYSNAKRFNDDGGVRWRGAFVVPPEVASDPQARFALRWRSDVLLELPAPLQLMNEATKGPLRSRRRKGPKGPWRGALAIVLALQLALVPVVAPLRSVAFAAVGSGEATTTTVTQQTLTGGEEERSTATIPLQATPSEPAASGNREVPPQPPPTTTSSTAQTVSPDTEPAVPSTGAGTTAAPPMQPKSPSTAPVSSGTRGRKPHGDAASAPASRRPAAAEEEDEPVAPAAMPAEDEILSPQLAELTGRLGGVEEGPPAFLIPIYEAAGRRYHVPWRVLAAINAVETDYGRDLSVSTAGAVGWMQFMPETWAQWAVDADSDGEKNPYSPQDAIFTAARYLQASGAKDDLAGAIFAYNHAQWYVTEVLLRAHLLANTASFAGLEKGYSLPLGRRYMNTLGRTDDGVDIETAPDGALVYSITPGIVTAVASDPAGFGPNYPVVRATAGALHGQNIYYGHVAVSLVHPGEVVAAGQPVAIMGHTGDAASLGHGHIEIGFSDAGGDPLSHHGAGAWTPSGDLMRAFLVALSSSFGVHNE
jgi:hypothetical protein